MISQDGRGTHGKAAAKLAWADGFPCGPLSAGKPKLLERPEGGQEDKPSAKPKDFKAQSQLASLLEQMAFHAGLYRLAHNDRK